MRPFSNSYKPSDSAMNMHLRKAKRLAGDAGDDPESVNFLNRNCLKCETLFVAIGRFTRICNTCKRAKPSDEKYK